MQYNPDLSPNPVVGDESGIIKLSIFVGYYFYLLELAFANLKYIKVSVSTMTYCIYQKNR